MAKTPWQFLGSKSHCWKAHFFKICFFVKYFRQRLLSIVNMGLHAAIIRLSPLIREGLRLYKPCIVGDPRMMTPPLKNPGYAPDFSLLCDVWIARCRTLWIMNRKCPTLCFLFINLECAIYKSQMWLMWMCHLSRKPRKLVTAGSYSNKNLVRKSFLFLTVPERILQEGSHQPFQKLYLRPLMLIYIRYRWFSYFHLPNLKV